MCLKFLLYTLVLVFLNVMNILSLFFLVNMYVEILNMIYLLIMTYYLLQTIIISNNDDKILILIIKNH